MANILVLGPTVPFTKGGQEILVNTLVKELNNRGHNADKIELPFNTQPKESYLTQAAFWRAFPMDSFGGEDIDLIIATKFPCYFAKAKKKSIWLVHQLRSAYDLYGDCFSDFSDDPRDEALRTKIYQSDTKVIGEANYVSAISKNVSNRLKEYNNIDAEVLYPPLPLGDKYKSGPYEKDNEKYILSVGRICNIKRVHLAIRSLINVDKSVKLKIVGSPDEPGIIDFLQNEIEHYRVQDRVEFLGRVSEEDLINLFANSLAVYYAPFNEDYGYVTLEAFASKKPVIAANDSGGVLEFVVDGENGFVCKPNADSIGEAINKLNLDLNLTKKLGENAFKFIKDAGFMDSSWDKVINNLLKPINN